MSKFDDEVTNPIVLGIALDKNISADKVREVLDQYWKGVTYLVETGKPYQIKLDFFGKLKPKKQFEEIQEKITKKFGGLTPRENDAVSN